MNAKGAHFHFSSRQVCDRLPTVDPEDPPDMWLIVSTHMRARRQEIQNCTQVTTDSCRHKLSPSRTPAVANRALLLLATDTRASMEQTMTDQMRSTIRRRTTHEGARPSDPGESPDALGHQSLTTDGTELDGWSRTNGGVDHERRMTTEAGRPQRQESSRISCSLPNQRNGRTGGTRTGVGPTALCEEIRSYGLANRPDQNSRTSVCADSRRRRPGHAERRVAPTLALASGPPLTSENAVPVRARRRARRDL